MGLGGWIGGLQISSAFWFEANFFLINVFCVFCYEGLVCVRLWGGVLLLFRNVSAHILRASVKYRHAFTSFNYWCRIVYQLVCPTTTTQPTTSVSKKAM